MSKLNGLGPYNNGAETGRGIGLCSSFKPTDIEKFGKGLGLKKHSTGKGIGFGKRLKYNLVTNNKTKEV